MQDRTSENQEEKNKTKQLILELDKEVGIFRYEVCRLDSLNYTPNGIAKSIRERYPLNKQLKRVTGGFVANYIDYLKDKVKDYFENGESIRHVRSIRKIPTIFLYKYFHSKGRGVDEDEFGYGEDGRLPEFSVTSAKHFEKHAPSMDYLKRYKNWNL